MKKKVIAIVLVIFIILGLMPVIKAADNIVTLEQIAEQIDKEAVVEVASVIWQITNKENIAVDIETTENSIIITAIDKIDEQQKLETVFTVNENILYSPKIAKTPEGDTLRIGEYDLSNTINVAKAIAKLEQIDPDILDAIWFNGNLEKYSVENEGIQLVDDIYQINLSKKLDVLDVRPLRQAMEKFESDYAPKLADTSELSESVSAIWEDGNIKIVGRDAEASEVESTVLTLEGSVLTTETINVSSDDMGREDNFTYFATLNFMDCIGQVIYDYEPTEMSNFLTRMLKNETQKEYTLEEDGIEKINLNTGENQFAIDISKTVVIEEAQPPIDEEPTNQEQNNTTETNQEDNTVANGEIPQTGSYINLATGIILLLFIVVTLIMYRRYSKKNLS